MLRSLYFSLRLCEEPNEGFKLEIDRALIFDTDHLRVKNDFEGPTKKPFVLSGVILEDSLEPEKEGWNRGADLRTIL